MRKYAPTLVAFVGLLFVANIFLKNISNPPITFDEEALRKQILAFKTQLPKVVDTYTTAVGASYENQVLRYEFVMDGVKSSNIEKLKNTNLVSKLFGVCTNNVLSLALSTGSKIEYAYSIAGSNNGFTITLTDEDCAPFFQKGSVSLADYYVELQNKNVPLIVDEETRTVAFRREGNLVHLDYQFYRLLTEDLNIAALNENIAEFVLPTMCATPDYRALSQQNYAIQLNYFDMQNVKVTHATVSEESCK